MGKGSTGTPHIQPQPGPDFEDEDLPSDERLDRLLADGDLLYRLQMSRYSAEEWQRPAEEFGRYGYDVFVGWIFNGKVWTKVYEKTGWQLTRPTRPLTEDDVRTLAADTVVASLDAFLEKVLKRNKWVAHGGASLKSYFVGQGCFQFPNALKTWRREQDRLLRHERTVADPTTYLRGTAPAADVPLIDHENAVAGLSALSTDKAREALTLQWAGYSLAEIAARLDEPDEKTVENLIGYQRRRLRDQKTPEEDAG
jgi:DNA-directed RNA polymerase specialized sigma24 family protein